MASTASTTPRRWILRRPSRPTVEALARAEGLDELLAILLANRGWSDPAEVRAHLRPDLKSLHDPALLPGMPAAQERLARALRDGETILVHGDYDVDGICGATLLTRWIRRIGGDCTAFVPHRLRDGYDFGSAGLDAAKRVGATLVVTCDSGILAHAMIEEAAAAGVDVVVTDHHRPGDTLPTAVAVVNPNRDDDDYPAPDLCGTGVAFKLCQFLAAAAGIDEADLWPDLDLVALATVADLVPLVDENRVLVRFGLRYLAATRKPGLRALLETTGLADRDTVDAGQVGFVLAPRINAAGRVGESDAALELLMTNDPKRAAELARALEDWNAQRKDEDRATLAEALDRLEETYDPERDFGVVLAGEGWHPGVIGIVASRVVERIHRPVVMIGLDGKRGRGSARSIPGVHVLDAIRAGESVLGRFGGHRQAAGLDIDRGNVDAFRASFNAAVREQLGGVEPVPHLSGDCVLAVEDLNDDLHAFLEHMGPFGIGNPRPVFMSSGLRIVGEPRIVGEGHLKLRLAGESSDVDAIGFGLAGRRPLEALREGRMDALFQLRESEYRGRRTLQARLVDVRPSGEAPASEVSPRLAG